MKEFTYGFVGVLVAGLAIVYAVDRYLRRPPVRYMRRTV